YYPDEIHEKLIEIMPLYDNEITGKETPNQMKHIQTKYLSPIDWDRKAIESNILQKEKERKGKMKLEKRMKNIIKKII
ncbi:MAG: hypothetical protein LBG92_11110, partial [Prevotellaceae bacterium]|nr:hypothetical protein [Prevotellaceae bacterium]